MIHRSNRKLLHTVLNLSTSDAAALRRRVSSVAPAVARLSAHASLTSSSTSPAPVATEGAQGEEKRRNTPQPSAASVEPASTSAAAGSADLSSTATGSADGGVASKGGTEGGVSTTAPSAAPAENETAPSAASPAATDASTTPATTATTAAQSVVAEGQPVTAESVVAEGQPATAEGEPHGETPSAAVGSDTPAAAGDAGDASPSVSDDNALLQYSPLITHVRLVRMRVIGRWVCLLSVHLPACM